MIVNIIRFINIIVQLITLLVIIKVFLSYFMSPYHPVRLNIDRIVEPMLRPIRRSYLQWECWISAQLYLSFCANIG